MIPPGFSLSDALDRIFANDIANQVDEVFIEPPEATVDTDEDSAEKDQGGMLHNLTGRQLRAPVEIRLIDNTRINTNKHSSVSSSESPPSESAPNGRHLIGFGLGVKSKYVQSLKMWSVEDH
ncbi:hypothetical protein FQA39_LY09913 [Lamprigera yunnana]|nr:hypothetical protein FQA39_LY09913 [Lamprigera yunnana]